MLGGSHPDNINSGDPWVLSNVKPTFLPWLYSLAESHVTNTITVYLIFFSNTTDVQSVSVIRLAPL